jgi:hypothetical protein
MWYIIGVEARRTLALVFLLLAIFFAGLVAGSPNYDAGCKNSDTDKAASLGLGREGKNSPAYTANKSDCNPPHWYTALKRPEWLQLIVASIGIGVLVWQGFLTRKAAEAASDSASAAKTGIAVTVSKERARLRLASPEIHIIDSATRNAGPPHPCEQIKFRIDCHGTTDAFIISGRAGSWLSDKDGHFLAGWGAIPWFPFPTVIKANSDGITESEPIDPITEYMVKNTPPDTYQKFTLNLAIQVEYRDVFQTKTHWKMNERYSWHLSYFAKGDGFFSWSSTPEKHYVEQEEAN